MQSPTQKNPFLFALQIDRASYICSALILQPKQPDHPFSIAENVKVELSQELVAISRN